MEVFQAVEITKGFEHFVTKVRHVTLAHRLGRRQIVHAATVDDTRIGGSSFHFVDR
jgi:hypothetical protein